VLEGLGLQSSDLSAYRKIASQTLVLVLDFMAQEVFRANSLQQANYLLQATSDRKLDVLKNTAQNKAKRLAQRVLHRSSNYFLQRYQFERLYYDLTGVEVSREKKVVANLNSVKTAQYLDIFYFIEKLKSEINLLYWGNVYEHQHELTFKHEILQHLREKKYDHVALSIYHLAYLCYAEPDEDNHYHSLYELISSSMDIFPDNEANDILFSAINYCLRKANQGREIFLREVFKLYDSGLETETLFVNDTLPAVTFRNICTTSLRLQEYDWTLNFIRDYQSKLPDQNRESLVALSTAQVYFYQEDFETALTYLRDYESQDPNLNFTAKLLSCAALYELDYYDVLDAQMESFKVLLYREKSIPEKLKKPNQNFLKYLQKILRAGVNKEKLLKIHATITTNRDAYNTSWLVTKIEEITGPVAEKTVDSSEA